MVSCDIGKWDHMDDHKAEKMKSVDCVYNWFVSLSPLCKYLKPSD